jgi:hypothetical protein
VKRYVFQYESEKQEMSEISEPRSPFTTKKSRLDRFIDSMFIPYVIAFAGLAIGIRFLIQTHSG